AIWRGVSSASARRNRSPALALVTLSSHFQPARPSGVSGQRSNLHPGIDVRGIVDPGEVETADPRQLIPVPVEIGERGQVLRRDLGLQLLDPLLNGRLELQFVQADTILFAAMGMNREAYRASNSTFYKHGKIILICKRW
ncbi:MAG: hypothetical protein ABSG85_09725, partial [Spirochaetia bacterium]